MPENLIETMWIFHAALMTLGFVLIFIGFFFIFMRKRAQWLKPAHKVIEIIGPLFAAVGLAVGIYMTSDEHFEALHDYLGVITLIFIVVCPALGIARSRIPRNALVKALHRWWSVITVALMLATLISGIVMELEGG